VDVAPLAAVQLRLRRRAHRAGRSGWSEHLRQRFAGQPVKPVAALHHADERRSAAGRIRPHRHRHRRQPGLCLQRAPARRDRGHGQATWLLDLLPQHSRRRCWPKLASARPAQPVHAPEEPPRHPGPEDGAAARTAHARAAARPGATGAGDQGAAAGAGAAPADRRGDQHRRRRALSRRWMPHFMLRALPGVFCAGEMLDWEAPTGGYLLTACFATGRAAAQGALEWLAGARRRVRDNRGFFPFHHQTSTEPSWATRSSPKRTAAPPRRPPPQGRHPHRRPRPEGQPGARQAHPQQEEPGQAPAQGRLSPGCSRESPPPGGVLHSNRPRC
jgi:hypothetical protein